MNPQELSNALRKEAILNGHSVLTVVSGFSMYPFFRQGDILTIEPVSIDTVNLGDIVVYELKDIWIAHRVIQIISKKGEATLVLKGDTNLKNDSGVNAKNYIGIVQGIERSKKKVSLKSNNRKNWTKVILKSKKSYSALIRLFLKITFFRSNYINHLKGFK